MDKISLIIAAYNIEAYIEECMESCVRQTDRDFEIIVVDDGSEDDTPRILEQYQKDSRVKIIRHEENRGLSIARRTGYRESCGEYIWFVDGDDRLEENAVECLRQSMEEMDCDLIAFRFFVDSPDRSQDYPLESFGPAEGAEYLIRLLTGKIPPSIFSKLIRKSYIENNRFVFPPRLNCGEDVALAASLGMHAPSVVLIQDVLYHYRIRFSSLSVKPSACMLDILPATLFVKDRMQENGLLEKFREEYEYYAFLHNLYYRFESMFILPNPFRDQLIENWLSLGIDISNNRYFKENFKEITPKNLLMKELKRLS